MPYFSRIAFASSTLCLLPVASQTGGLADRKVASSPRNLASFLVDGGRFSLAERGGVSFRQCLETFLCAEIVTCDYRSLQKVKIYRSILCLNRVIGQSEVYHVRNIFLGYDQIRGGEIAVDDSSMM